MEPAQTVGGVIQDEHGKPIQGVEVKLRCETDSGILLEMEPYSHTDSEGRWKYDYAPKKLGNINIVLQHPEFIDRGFIRPSALEIEKMANRSSLMIMKKGIVVTGTVTDPDGRPIANASVVQGMSRFGSFPPIMRTDKEGHYRLTLTDPDQEMAPLPMTRGDGFAYNANVLTVISPGFAPDLRQIDVKEGMPPVDFRLEKGGVIRIKAVDKAGKPVEGANISPDHWRNCRNLIDAGIAGKTDKDGLWTWTWAPKDAVEMSIKKTGYMSIFSYPLKPKETEQVVNLYPSLIISGRVIDAETKEPVKYFRVLRGGSFSPTNGDKTNIWLRVDFVEGINGLYNIVITEPGLLLRIEADGYKPEISREFKDDEGDVTCDFSLNKGKVLNVAVILPDGKPAAGANVQIVPTPPGKQVFGQPSVKNGRLLPSGFYEVLKVKADGQLPIEQQDGEFMLIVVHDQGYAQTTSRELMAHPEIKLEAWARVEGVIRQGGKPVPHLNIFVNENRSYDLKTICNFDDSSETDAEGKFLFSKLRPGKWFITGDNGRFGTVDLAPGQTLKRDFNAP
jgi:uncharacterized GH25 family protein